MSGRSIASVWSEHTWYDPYGNMTVLNATWNPVSGNVSQYGWRYNFQGGRFDVTTGWYDFRNRDYIPTEGRWAERDPLGFGGGASDLYSLEGGSPAGLSDPMGEEGVGHHWVPMSVLAEFWEKLTEEAKDIALGSWSGDLDGHNFGPMGGVKHSAYNKRVKELFQELVDKKKGVPLTAEDMTAFVERVEKGLDNSGKTDPVLKPFNDAIRQKRAKVLAKKPNARPPGCPEGVSDRGKWYRTKRGRFFASVLGAMIASAASDALADTVGALDVAGRSRLFRDGVQALSEGDLHRAETNFFGAGGGLDGATIGGFVAELQQEIGKEAAANFIEAYKLAKKRAECIAQQKGIPEDDG